ncbi:MAG: SPOR domain-containing protein [Microvirgula sp.]
MTEPTEKPTPTVSRKSLLIAAGIVTTALIAWPVYNSVTRPVAPPGGATTKSEGIITPPHPAAVETAPDSTTGKPAEPATEAAAEPTAPAAEAPAPAHAPAEPVTPAQPKAAPAAAAPATSAAHPAASKAAEKPAAPAPKAATRDSTPPPAKTAPRETEAPVAKSATAQKPAATAKSAPAAAAAAPTPPVPYRTAPPTEAARPDGSSVGYRIQLGLFSNIDNASALVQRLKKSGIAAQSETRVSVGPFTTRAEADEAMTQLKAMGLTPLLAPNGKL